MSAALRGYFYLTGKEVCVVANMTVVRNEPHVRADVSAIENHNERNNTTYSNLDVVLEQSENNVYFKQETVWGRVENRCIILPYFPSFQS